MSDLLNDIPHLLTPLRRVKKAIPKLSRRVHQLRGQQCSPGIDWPDWCFLPFRAGDSPVGKALLSPVDSADLDAGEALMMATWQVTKGVYEIDPSVYEELADTELNSIPAEVLYRLPEWAVFIVTPGIPDSPGFWVRLEWREAEPPHLCFLILRPDGSTDRVGFDVAPTLTVRSAVVRQARKDIAKLLMELFVGGMAIDAAEIVTLCDDDEARRALAVEICRLVLPRLPLVVYLCSVNCDVRGREGEQPKLPKAKKTKLGKRLFPRNDIRQWNVGVRKGAALRRARASHTGRGNGNGNAKRPHCRKAHFHSFWTGTKTAPDGTPRLGESLVVKWIPPVLINVDDPDGLPVTVRSVDQAALPPALSETQEGAQPPAPSRSPHLSVGIGLPPSSGGSINLDPSS